MNKNSIKPSPEAKALSLFFMAYKNIDPVYKEKAKRTNRLWDLVRQGELSKEDYATELESILESYGGYDQVVEKTVRYYIDKFGEWKSQGDDKYGLDSQKVADELLKK